MLGKLLIIIGIITVVILGSLGSYILFRTRVEEGIINNILQDDGTKKSTVNYVHSLIKEYFAQTGTYPKNLAELRTKFTLDNETLSTYNRSPYHFDSNGDAYEYSVKLNNGEIFKGDAVSINKYLDVVVRTDVNNIMIGLLMYYDTTKRLPKDLDELSTLPNFSALKFNNNPNTNKPYVYIHKIGDASFSVIGILSDGSEYKKEGSVAKY